MRRARVGISAGDPSGIGLEVTLKALGRADVRRRVAAVVYGDASTPRGWWEVVEVTRLAATDRLPATPTRAGGRAQYAYFEAAIAAAKAHEVDALCTAPVSKEAITRAGIPFRGHTEVLALKFRAHALMLMAGPRLNVAVVTTHIALRDVSRALRKDSIVRALATLDAGLRNARGKRPTIAVCGLNPHAGEGGLWGTEEARIIEPAIRAARQRGISADGPLPADGLFAKVASGFPYDVALAMYHDQGLVVAKALDFAQTVNVTLGLPVPRTSPDHGVAYDIAGKDVADDTPMASALLKAAALATRAANESSSVRRLISRQSA